ncbi:MAG: type VI secretion system baseplate subunit TssG [Zoogloea sp.]|nr:type VI secretion system baseplate subunit TssG [Zoogloea sp.]
MASPSRRTSRDLAAEVHADAPHFSFFQAVRLLALAAGDARQARPSLPKDLRFGTPLSLAFPASEITGLQPYPAQSRDDCAPAGTEEAPKWLMTVAFMGLTGPSGTLPVPYTELLVDRHNQYRDSAAHRFLDIFSHRSISLFYEAWRKHRFYLSFEAGQPDHFSRNMLDLVGLGLGKLQQRLGKQRKGIPDRFLIHYAGLLSRRPVSSANIAALVRGFFEVDAQIEQFVGQWIKLPASEQSSLGRSFGQLGRDAFLGERLWDRQSKIRVRLGPLTREAFSELLPGQPGAAALHELIHFCVGHTLSCDLTLVLQRDAVPPPRLGTRAASKPRLGQNLWLNSQPLRHDPDDAGFALLA